jgi:hypothetical protein
MVSAKRRTWNSQISTRQQDLSSELLPQFHTSGTAEGHLERVLRTTKTMEVLPCPPVTSFARVDTENRLRIRFLVLQRLVSIEVICTCT